MDEDFLHELRVMQKALVKKRGCSEGQGYGRRWERPCFKLRVLLPEFLSNSHTPRVVYVARAYAYVRKKLFNALTNKYI
jgi:hypothetical protein